MDLLFSVPQSWLLACIAGGLLAGAVQYYLKSPFQKRHPAWNAVLALLRALGVSLVLFLLLGPQARLRFQESEQPAILVLGDDSRSMTLHGDSAAMAGRLNQTWRRLGKRLSPEMTPAWFAFGESLQSQSDSLRFDAAGTNIAQALSDAADLYYGRHVGAAVVLSDGIYNEGIQPEAVAKGLPFPVFTLGVGDTAPPADVFIQDVVHNRLAYQGNVFPVKALIQARGLKGRSVRVRLLRGDEVVAVREASIDQDAFFTEINFQPEAQKPGLKTYQVVIDPLEEEFSTINNRRRFYIEVLQSKRRVVMIARAPHPDIGAMRTALEADQFELEVYNFQGNSQPPEGLMEALDEAEVVLLHDLPSAGYSLGALREKVLKQKLPVWMVAGEQTKLQRAQAWDLGFQRKGGGQGNVRARARWNENFSLYALSQEEAQLIEQWPPLQTPFSELALSRGTDVLFWQQVGNVSTERPLMFFANRNGRKTAVLLGTGNWRWSMFNFTMTEDQQAYRTWVRKTIRYLARREDKRLFRIVDLPDFFPEQDDVVIKAELYNPSLELLEGGAAELRLKTPEGEVFEYSFVEQGRFYEARLGRLKPGLYAFTAQTTIAGKQREVSGQFLVREQKQELMEAVARYDVLRRMSDRTGGAFQEWTQVDSLVRQIQNRRDIRPISYVRTEYRDLIRETWLLGLLVLLLGVEWGVRKYLGHL